MPEAKRRPPWGPGPIREGERMGVSLDMIGIFI